MTDKLRMEHINCLPQPFVAKFCGGDEWEVYDIDVETGLMRILVAGKLQIKHIGEVDYFTDMQGVQHDVDSFYTEDNS